MSTHFDNVCRVIAREMVAAGLSATVAPVPAALAASRIMAGEARASVILELTERYRSQEATPKAEPVKPEPTGPEPLHVRFAREAGKTAASARTAADRVSDAVALGNPWGRDSFNVTRQQLVAGLDPDRAAQLRREAGR